MPTTAKTTDEKTRAKREALFQRLERVYSELQDLQTDYNKTAFKCKQSGGCCQVGLTLHYMECENLARAIRKRHEGDPAGLQDTIERLKLAFHDPTWTQDEITGSLMCAMWDDGCTIYLDRPAVCRMYGVILTIDDFCPRERLAGDEPLLFSNPQVDRLVRELYTLVDTYGRMDRDRDYTIFMPAGVLEFLLPPDELKAFRAATHRRFWKRTPGYRTQFKSSGPYQRSLEPEVAQKRINVEARFLTWKGMAPRGGGRPVTQTLKES